MTNNCEQKFLCFAIIFQALLQVSFSSGERPPELNKPVMDVIRAYGYPFENHVVQTEDGYLLDVHRIPHGLTNDNLTNRPVALLVSGIICSSADWANKGPDNSLAFILADEGFDVWMANNRGSTWARKHVTLDPDIDKKQFWNFSFHELGIYDTPAIIDRALDVAKQKSLFYVGYSQGTTVLYILLDFKPEYNDKIIWMGALGSIISLQHTQSTLYKIYRNFQDTVKTVFENAEVYELLPNNQLIRAFGQTLCGENSVLMSLCVQLLNMLAGETSGQVNEAILPILARNSPAGASLKQLYHYIQLENGLFRQYDYGKDGNMRQYGQIEPPRYDLSKIQIPITFLSGGKDKIASLTDIKLMASQLPYQTTVIQIFPKMNHLDLMWGRNSLIVVRSIVDTMKSYL